MTSNERTKKPFRVLFFCGDRSLWGHSHLNCLLSEPLLEIVAVVVATDKRWETFRESLTGEIANNNLLKKLLNKFVIRAEFDLESKSKSLISKYGIQTYYCDDINSETWLDKFRKMDVDLLFCAAYPQIFGSELLSLSKLGAFNSHPSLLPRCRGADPIFWTIVSSEKKSGVTIHCMTEDVDKGNIVTQVEIDLSLKETYQQLYGRLVSLIPNLIENFVENLESGDLSFEPQIDLNASYFRNPRKLHRRIFWTQMTANQIYNLVRACGGRAYFYFGNFEISVIEVDTSKTNRNITNNIKVPPGTVVDIKQGIPVVSTREGFVLLKKFYFHSLRSKEFSIGQRFL
jgi:methionyl-tRNA formyltransferase